MFGKKRSEETRRKQSETLKNNYRLKTKTNEME